MDDWENLEPDPADDELEEQSDTQEKQTEVPTARSQPADPAEPSEARAEGADDANDDEPICRICFSGAEEADLGRLITPCLCRGTVAKVHVACLNRWRNSSPGSTSYFQCDQCKYRYRIKRAKIAGLAENKLALATLTIFTFIFLVFVNGYVGNWILKQARSENFASSVFFTEPPETYHSWHYRDSYLPLEAVGQAVEMASKVAEDLSNPREETSLSNKVAQDEDGETSYRMVRSRKRAIRKRVAKSLKSLMSHFLVGISTTGIGSFLWLLLTLPLWPLHPMRTGLFRTFRGREGRGAPSSFGTILLALFVVVGLVKSLQLCWKVTRKGAHFVLRRAEDGILEVR